MHGRLWTLAVLLLLLVAAPKAVLAAECSTEQIATIETLQEKVSNNTECPIDTEASSLAEYCSNAACVSLIEDIVAELPDCDYFGINVRDALAFDIAQCGDSSGSTSSIASEVGSWGVDDETECTADQVQTMETILSSMSQMTECQNLASDAWTLSSSSSSFDICAPLTTECIGALTTKLAELPDCSIEGLNTKSFFDSVLAACGLEASQGSSSSSAAPTLAGYGALIQLVGVAVLLR